MNLVSAKSNKSGISMSSSQRSFKISKSKVNSSFGNTKKPSRAILDDGVVGMANFKYIKNVM